MKALITIVSLGLAILGVFWMGAASIHDTGIDKAIDLAWAASSFAEAAWVKVFNAD